MFDRKEWHKQYHKKRNKTIKGKYLAYKNGSKRRGYDFLLTEEELRLFWQKPCFYCGDPIETVGLDRIDNDKGYEIGNVVSCCAFCNMAKKDWTKEYFLDKIHKIARRHDVKDLY